MAFINFNKQQDDVGLIAITLFTEAKPLVFIIDTGSTVSLIDKRTTESLIKAQKFDIQAKPIVGFTGEFSPIQGLRANFSHDIFSFEIDFQISDLSGLLKELETQAGFKANGTLGIDFLRKYRCHLDFKKNRLHLG